MFAKDIGIDLGTANTLICVKGKGIVLNEPTVVAYNERTDEVVAVGHEAKEMIGRTAGNVRAMRPLRDGVIADYGITSEMLRKFIRKVRGNAVGRVRVIICIPWGVTEVERRAVDNAAKSAGAREVYIMEEPMCAAIGAGLPVLEPTGSMIVDIGGGTSEVAVISMGGIVTSKSERVAGDALDAAIVSFIKKKYNVLVGDRTAEQIKIGIGSACPYENEAPMQAHGRNLIDGLPAMISVEPADVREALSDSLYQIIDAIHSTLEKTPPELAADIIDNGITLAGGGALLRGFDNLINRETGIPVHIAPDPLNCVVNGTGATLADLARYGNILLTAE